MNIFIDNESLHVPPTPEILDRELNRFEKNEIGTIELSDGRSGFCRAEWDGDECFMLQIDRGDSQVGVLLPNSEVRQARAAMEEYFRGYTPQVPMKHLEALLAPNELGGRFEPDFEDDCPLCQLMREHEKKNSGG